jgi:hypothetical protein
MSASVDTIAMTTQHAGMRMEPISVHVTAASPVTARIVQILMSATAHRATQMQPVTTQSARTLADAMLVTPEMENTAMPCAR